MFEFSGEFAINALKVIGQDCLGMLEEAISYEAKALKNELEAKKNELEAKQNEAKADALEKLQVFKDVVNLVVNGDGIEEYITETVEDFEAEEKNKIEAAGLRAAAALLRAAGKALLSNVTVLRNLATGLRNTIEVLKANQTKFQNAVDKTNTVIGNVNNLIQTGTNIIQNVNKYLSVPNASNVLEWGAGVANNFLGMYGIDLSDGIGDELEKTISNLVNVGYGLAGSYVGSTISSMAYSAFGNIPLIGSYLAGEVASQGIQGIGKYFDSTSAQETTDKIVSLIPSFLYEGPSILNKDDSIKTDKTDKKETPNTSGNQKVNLADLLKKTESQKDTTVDKQEKTETSGTKKVNFGNIFKKKESKEETTETKDAFEEISEALKNPESIKNTHEGKLNQAFEEAKKNEAGQIDTLPDLELDRSIEEIAADVIAGKYGNGSERKAALGDKYSEVQKEVNRQLKELQDKANNNNDEPTKVTVKDASVPGVTGAVDETQASFKSDGAKYYQEKQILDKAYEKVEYCDSQIKIRELQLEKLNDEYLRKTEEYNYYDKALNGFSMEGINHMGEYSTKRLETKQRMDEIEKLVKDVEGTLKTLKEERQVANQKIIALTGSTK